MLRKPIENFQRKAAELLKTAGETPALPAEIAREDGKLKIEQDALFA